MLDQAKNDDELIHHHPERVKRVEGAQNIFFVGIKGVAMANLALILNKMGKEVSGSDVEEEFITDRLLKKNKIAIQIGFDPKNLPNNTNLLIYSASHQGIDNPQIVEAKKRSINVLSQAELLGQLTSQFKTTIAVCGSHGKTTTASLLSYALIKLGVKPSYMVGSSSFNGYPGGDFSGTDYIVIEADEYGVNPPKNKTPKFHFLNPDYILCTNIDFDHPDVYKNINSVKESFSKFFSKNTILKTAASNMVNKKLILCIDDKNLMAVARKFNSSSYLTYGFNPSADLRIVKYQAETNGSSFQLQINRNRHSGTSTLLSVLSLSKDLFRIDSGVASLPRMTIKLFGAKNISNTAGVILTLLRLGFSSEKIKEAIKDYKGAKRRFEQVYVKNDTFLFDDYAHHPNEIEATISAAKSRFPKKRIIIIFQPHTYSRTQSLLNEFAKSLSLADQTYILPIFASARENSKQFNVNSIDIENASSNSNLKAVYSKKELLELLTSNLKLHDVVFTMGAGDVYKLSNDIIEIIKHL